MASVSMYLPFPPVGTALLLAYCRDLKGRFYNEPFRDTIDTIFYRLDV